MSAITMPHRAAMINNTVGDNDNEIRTATPRVRPSSRSPKLIPPPPPPLMSASVLRLPHKQPGGVAATNAFT